MPASHSGFRLGVLHVLLVAATVAPVVAVEHLALADLPNHLARLYVLASSESDPVLRSNYEILPEPARYMLVDRLLAPLATVLDIYLIGRLFAAATLVLTYAGVLLLSMTLHGRLTIWPALALPVLYHHAFAWGFMVYCVGISALLIAFAAWIRIARRGNALRGTTLFGLSAILFSAHTLIFGQFAVLVAAHSLSVSLHRTGRRLRMLSEQAAVIGPAFGLAAAAYTARTSAEAVSAVRTTIYGGPADKLVAFLSPVLFSNSAADLLLMMAYLAGVLVLVASRQLLLARNMAIPLAAMFLLCAAMPNTLLGVWGVDFRLPPVLLLLAIAATCPAALRARPVPPAVTAVIAALVLFRAATVWAPLHGADRQFAEFRNALSGIPAGARLIVSLDEATSGLAMPARAYWHLAQLAVIERGAFVPFLFTQVTHVGPSARNRDLDTPSGHPITSGDLDMGLEPEFIATQANRQVDAYHRIYWADWPRNFDYLIRIAPTQPGDRLAATTRPVGEYSFFEILAVEPGPPSR